MSDRETEHLRVLIANERKDRPALVAPIVVALGHEVIAREIDVNEVGAVTARERPDVALVGLGESSQHALVLIEKIVHEAFCPVILLIHEPNPSTGISRPLRSTTFDSAERPPSFLPFGGCRLGVCCWIVAMELRTARSVRPSGQRPAAAPADWVPRPLPDAVWARCVSDL